MFKKSDLIKFKTSNLSKYFTIVNSFKTNFLPPGAKKAIIYLQKDFIETLILRYDNLKYYIHIENNILEYFISKVLSQMTLDYFFSNYMTYKNLDPYFSKSKIC